jgi:steroid 5-alpha reductase family enzyme
MITEFWGILCAGGIVVFFLFLITWLISIKINNYSLVDITWSYSLAILVPIYALLCEGFPFRKLLAVFIAMIWSIRLGTYLLVRIKRHHPNEDTRYVVLRDKWKGSVKRNFLGFFQAQAVLILLLSIPLLLTCLNPNPKILLIEWIGIAVWLIAICGESLADQQMGFFKKHNTDKKSVCQIGLWKYSRHPNYFFESLIWWGFFLFACGSPFGYLTIFAPIMILYFLLKVTGIPLTEKCAVANKGQVYLDYQKTTSAFIPWFRKKIS